LQKFHPVWQSANSSDQGNHDKIFLGMKRSPVSLITDFKWHDGTAVYFPRDFYIREGIVPLPSDAQIQGLS